MRILVVSDLHYRLPHYDWLVTAATDVVFAASGNHDLDGPGWHGEQVAAWLRRPEHQTLHVDGASVDVGDTRFTVCPWWDGPVTREEVAEQLAAAAVERPARWVWLPRPAGRDVAVPRRPPCVPGPGPGGLDSRAQSGRGAVRHIHQAPWVEGGSWHARLGSTWVFNAGKQIGKVPAHITLDTEAGTATWFGVFESQTISIA